MNNNYNNVLLVSEEYIKSNSPISNNLDDKYLLPSIAYMQRSNLEETIGSQLLRKLQELVGTSTIDDVENEHYKILLDDYVQDYLMYLAIADVTVSTSFKINNFGVNRTEDEKVYNASYSEVMQMKNYLLEKSNYCRYRLQRYLIANYERFRELWTWKTIADLRTNLYSANGCNVVLGGARGKSIVTPLGNMSYGMPNSTIDLN